MKKIKIVGIQTHFKKRENFATKEEIFLTGGVDYVRTVLPLRYLDKDKFETKVIIEPKDIDEMTKYNDIIYSGYIDTDILYVKLRVTANKNKCKWVMDLDDNIWNVHKTHPYYKDFTPTSKVLQTQTLILKDIEHLTTTNLRLKYKMKEELDKPFDSIQVIPNFIDLKDYDYKKIPKTKKKGLQIGYMGGSSHYDDVNKPEFLDALEEVMGKYKDVTFKTTFYMPTLKARFGHRYNYALGRYNVYRFIDEVWTQMASESDIFVAPLSDTPYSRCKSYIKFLEYSAAKRPSILEKIEPYNEVSGDHVLQAKTKNDWVKHLSTLIENPKKREILADASYEYIKDNHQIQDNVGMIEEYFASLTRG